MKIVNFVRKEESAMPGSMQYIKKFGNVSFTEMPFCDADNIALCEVFYMPFDKVVSESFTEEPRNFDEVCRAMFSYNGNRHRAPGLVLRRGISVKMMEMAKQKRYAEMKVVACTEVFKTNPAVQFGAATFILPDGTLVVAFRGTDDSIVGWKEDFDIFLKRSIPSHRLSVEYLENVAKHFDGDIIVMGHSKGGNVALYAGLNCCEKTRARIKCLYNDEGPGFFDNSPYRTKTYKDLLPRYRHFIPSASFIGVLLAIDKDYSVVKSSRLLGPMQHDLSTWQIVDGDVRLLPSVSKLAKINELILSGIIYRMNREQAENFGRVADAVVGGMGQENLLGVSKHVPSVVKGAVQSWKELDEEAKQELKETFVGTGEIIKGSVKLVVNEKNEENVQEALEELGSQGVTVPVTQ